MNEPTNPPFFLTYWNPFSEEAPGLGQSFINYVKEVSLADYTGKVAAYEVGQYINHATEKSIVAMGDAIDEASNNQIEAIKNANQELTEVLKSEFSNLNQRLTLFHLDQINTNILLNDISELLKLSDTEKQRQRSIELGLKFITAASKDEDLIIDATVELGKALALMPQDWFVMYQLGMCYLYFSSIQDLEMSQKYFLASAKYSLVDNVSDNFLGSLFNKSLLLKNATGAKYKGVYNEECSNEDINLITVESYLQVALVKYIQSKFEDAVVYATKAVNASRRNSKAWFFLAKYQSRLAKYDDAIYSLKKASEFDSVIHKFFESDQDIVKNPNLNFLIQECDEKLNDINIEKSIEKNKIQDSEEKHWQRVVEYLACSSISILYDTFIDNNEEEELQKIRKARGLGFIDRDNFYALESDAYKILKSIYYDFKDDPQFIDYLGGMVDFENLKLIYKAEILEATNNYEYELDFDGRESDFFIYDAAAEYLNFSESDLSLIPSKLNKEYFLAKCVEL